MNGYKSVYASLGLVENGEFRHKKARKSARTLHDIMR